MVFEKKQLSKALAIALMVACAVAFMPLLNGQAFAAAKTPKKVKSLKAAQVANTMTAKATWKKGTNCKKYNVKVDGVLVSKSQKAKSFTTDSLTVGAHKISVAGVNGKKVGKYKTVTVNIKAVVSAVKIDGVANVGATLTAVVYDPNGNPITDGVTYQWYRVNRSTGIVAEISGATGATYQIAAADGGDLYTIFVEATAGGQKVQSEPTKLVTNVRELASAEIVLPDGHTAPQLGDELTAKVTDTVGDAVKAGVKYQWYVGGKKVTGEAGTGSTFAIPAEKDTYKAYLGKSITVTVTADDKVGSYIGEVTSAATLPVIESTIPKGVKIETSAAAPFVGETIKAVFTPEGASDADATYQWFRDGLVIAEATGATYTVTKSDKGCVLVVKVKLSTDESASEFTFASEPSKEVKDPLVGATASVASNNAKTTVFTTANTAYVTVKDDKGQTIGSDGFVHAWYIDSVADENQLFVNAFNASKADFEQDAAGANGALALADNQYYLYRSTTKLESLVGHTLIAVAATKATSSEQGSVTSDPTAAVQAPLKTTNSNSGFEATALGFAGDTPASEPPYIAEKTTLTATLCEADIEAEATVAYKWYKMAAGAEEYEEIAGVTGATYAIPAADIGVTAYKVVVTGTGDFYGTATGTITEITVAKNSGQTVSVSPVLTGGTEGGKVEGVTYAAFIQAGDALAASASVASAEPYMTYSWTYDADGAGPEAADDPVTGPTFTVPAAAKSGATVTLSATSNMKDYVVASESDKVALVKAALTSVTLKSSATWATSTVEAGHDGVANPNVGEVLSTVVKPSSDGVAYQWYADGEKIKDATDDEYMISADEFGKTITVEVKGTDDGGYAGSKVTSTATGTVNAIGELKIRMGGTILDNKSIVGVGNVLNPVVVAYVYDGDLAGGTHELVKIGQAGLEKVAKYNWAVGNKAVEGASYTVMADDAGNKWTCTASGIEAAEEGALTWGNGLEIVGDTQLAATLSLENNVATVSYIPEDANVTYEWYLYPGTGEDVFKLNWNTTPGPYNKATCALAKRYQTGQNAGYYCLTNGTGERTHALEAGAYVYAKVIKGTESVQTGPVVFDGTDWSVL